MIDYLKVFGGLLGMGAGLILLVNAGIWIWLWSLKRKMVRRDDASEFKGREEWLAPLARVEEMKREQDEVVLGRTHSDALLEGLRRQERERKAKLVTN